jgi:predicted O-linked N-acetylglucosamine transferase (SPINDLY family)
MINGNTYDVARDALLANDCDQAISLFQQCIEVEPAERKYYWNLGLCYLLANDRELAQNVWMSVLLNANEEEGERWNLELINFLSCSVLEYLDQQEYKPVQKIIEILQEADPDYEMSNINSQIKEITARLMNKAVAKSLQMKFDEAESTYQRILDLSPENAEAWQNLGMVCYERARVELEKARVSILESLKFDDSIDVYHYNFGLINEATGQLDLAKQSYREAINLNPENVDAYNNLGLLEIKTNNSKTAQLVFQDCINNNPKHFGSYINLGNIYLKQEDYTKAIECYEKALLIKHRDPIALENLAIAYEQKGDRPQALSYRGFAFFRKNQIQEAINFFNEYLKENIGDKYLYLALGDCYKMVNKRDDAISVYEQGIKNHPHEKTLYRFLLYLYQSSGQMDKCLEIIDLASKLFPDDLSFQRLDQTILPIVYRNEQEIEYYRQRFVHSLNNFCKQVENILDYQYPEQSVRKENLVESIGLRTNFYLHYQAQNDFLIQVKYGKVVNFIMSHAFPEFSFKENLLADNKEVFKIGYVSSKMQSLIGKMFTGWIVNSSSIFEVYCYNLESKIKSDNPHARIYSYKYYDFYGQLDDACERIYKDQLDILVFCDLGLNPVMTQLAGLRLAPIQCATWGHPITSGSPTIDYFISSEAIESPESQAYYSEELICLPNLGIVYPFPNAALRSLDTNRHYFNLDHNSVIYLCCQHIPKYLPQYDYLLPYIAKEVKNAKFIFIEGSDGRRAYSQLQERFKTCCQELEVDFDKHFSFLPFLDYHAYFDLLKLSDVFLDTIGFSGGITSLDAIACDLPIVTLPGEFFRGRQSYGMLKIIGVTETVANSEAEYINIAIKLGLEKAYRQEIREKIQANKHKLYDDTTCVTALEEFYMDAIKRHFQSPMKAN